MNIQYIVFGLCLILSINVGALGSILISEKNIYRNAIITGIFGGIFYLWLTSPFWKYWF